MTREAPLSKAHLAQKIPTSKKCKRSKKKLNDKNRAIDGQRSSKSNLLGPDPQIPTISPCLTPVSTTQ